MKKLVRSTVLAALVTLPNVAAATSPDGLAQQPQIGVRTKQILRVEGLECWISAGFAPPFQFVLNRLKQLMELVRRDYF